MALVEKFGICYHVDPLPDGGVRVESRVMPAGRLLSGVSLPHEALPLLAEVAGGAAAPTDPTLLAVAERLAVFVTDEDATAAGGVGIVELADRAIAAYAAATSIDADAMRVRIRSEVVADLQAEHDAETTALRNEIARLAGQTQSAKSGEVVPIAAAKKTAQRRKPAAKK